MTDAIPHQLEAPDNVIELRPNSDWMSDDPRRLSISPAPPSTIISTSRTLANRYLIQSLLGRGGFGVTFLARNIELPGQPLCVIKQLDPKVTNSHQIALASRFYLEAQSLSRLGTHAQIPTLLDYFQVDTDLYLVQSYIPGRVLTDLVDSQHTFTEQQVENFLIHMLQLLEYIHSNRLIHRDIKPQNIILCQTDRRFVLVDFGAVKDLDRQSNNNDSTIVSQSIGTPGFAPPEQLANRTVYASDIYALGMTCLYLLTGKEPTQFPTDPYTCELVWADLVDISVELSEIISKMVQVSLADRFKSATQVLIALDNRAVRAKLREYLDRKYAIAKHESIASQVAYPSVINWALNI